MDVFAIVEEARVILYVRGVYKQVNVYRRGDKYFAQWGSGFVRLGKHQTTTVPSIKWIDGEGFPQP